MVAVKIIGRVCGDQDQYGDASMNAFLGQQDGSRNEPETGREIRSHRVCGEEKNVKEKQKQKQRRGCIERTSPSAIGST